MIGGWLGEHTFVGLASVIAAVASLVSAVGTILNNRKLGKVSRDVDTVKKNGNGGGGG